MRIRYTYKGGEKLFDRDAGELVIGRAQPGKSSPDLDLTPDRAVSRQHARLVRDSAGLHWIEDLGSSSGTFVGADYIRRVGMVKLEPGSPIRIGETMLVIETSPADPSPARPDLQAAEGTVRSSVHSADAPAAYSRVQEAAGGRSTLLYELPLQLASTAKLDEVLAVLIRRLVGGFSATSQAAVLLLDPRTQQLLLAAHHPESEPRISITMAKQAMEKKEAFIWEPSAAEPAAQLASLSDWKSGQVLCAPMLWQGQPIGVLVLVGSENGRRYAQGDLDLLLVVAQYAAMAVAGKQMQDELKQNERVLRRLLANFSPEVGLRLLEQARKGRLRPGGVESEVTVLCSDLRGFTAATAGMEAEQVLDVLNDYFSVLVKCIFSRGGTVDKFIGDAILAVFGSPEPDPRQHEHAIEAALAMQEAVAKLNEQRRTRKAPTLEMGIGVHCGRVLHGFIGTEDRLEFTVIGEPVNLTSRFCEAAGPGQVLLSRELFQRLWRRIRAEQKTIRTKHEGELAAFLLQGMREGAA